MRLLTDLKEIVKRLETVEQQQTPTVTELEKKVMSLLLSTDEMAPNVALLMRSFAKVNETVLAIEKLEAGRQAVEAEKWKAHETKITMENEKFETTLSSCLKSKDLAVERSRVDGRITALKLDLESLGSDQMRNLKSLLGNDVGKVIGHVGTIKSSFDAALDIMRKRVDQIKDDFQMHKEEMAKEAEEKGQLSHALAETAQRQDRTEASVAALQHALTQVTQRHGTDIEMLQQDVEQAMAQQQSLADRMQQHEDDTARELKSVRRKVGELSEAVDGKLAAAKAASERFANEAAEALRQELLTQLSIAAAEARGAGDEMGSATEELKRKIHELSMATQQQHAEVAARAEATDARLEALRAHADAGFVTVRDDATRGVERCGEEIGRRLAAMTERRLGEVKGEIDGTVERLASEVNARAGEQQRHGERLSGGEARQADAEAQGALLRGRFGDAEKARGAWQAQMDRSTRNFRLQLDAHLQQMEELLNEKVGQNRSDVIRLGRSNVALSAIVHQVRSRIAQLLSSEEAAAQWHARLDAYAEMTTVYCSKEEATASVERPFLLSVPFQKFVSGAVQNVAEVLALLADNDTVRAVIVHPDPADEDMGWDKMVDDTRNRLMREFIAKVYSLVALKHPSIHPVVLSARTTVFTKFELALKIALSKHQRALVSQTLLGRRPLDACAACSRPMTRSGGGAPSSSGGGPGGGDRRAVVRGGLPGDRASFDAGAAPSSGGWSAGRPQPGTAGAPGFKELLTENGQHWAASGLGGGVGGLGGGVGGLGVGVGEKADRTGGGGYQGVGGGAYVMRGGFRMPKKGGLPSAGTGNFPSLTAPGTAPSSNSGALTRPGTAPARGSR